MPYLVSRYWGEKKERTSRVVLGIVFIFLVRKQSSSLVVGGLGFLWGKVREQGHTLVGGWLEEGW